MSAEQVDGARAQDNGRSVTSTEVEMWGKRSGLKGFQIPQ